MNRKVNVGQLFGRCYRSLSEFFEFVLKVTRDHEQRLIELEMRAGLRSGVTTLEITSTEIPEPDEDEEDPF